MFPRNALTRLNESFNNECMNSPIKNLRTELKMSRKELAKFLGKTEAAISNYENFVRRPDIETAYQLINLAKSRGLKKKLEDIYPPPNKNKDENLHDKH